MKMMNKQTLEEFIKIELEGYDEIDFSTYERFIELGAKWQQERMYSEEDLIAFSEWRDKYIDGLFTNNHTTQELLQKWLDQYKKK